jgi:hypothetical protein
MRPTARPSPMLAMPATSVANTSGPMIILIIRRNTSVRMDRWSAIDLAVAVSGAMLCAAVPTSTPSSIAMKIRVGSRFSFIVDQASASVSCGRDGRLCIAGRLGGDVGAPGRPCRGSARQQVPGARRDGEGGGQGGVGHVCPPLFLASAGTPGGVPAYPSGAVGGGLYCTRRARPKGLQALHNLLNTKGKRM